LVDQRSRVSQNLPCPQVRSTISDFAVFLTIMIMVLVDYLVGVPSPKLNVPDRFEVDPSSARFVSLSSREAVGSVREGVRGHRGRVRWAMFSAPFLLLLQNVKPTTAALNDRSFPEHVVRHGKLARGQEV